MTTYIPTRQDELSEEFFAAWFDAWCNESDEGDPADAFAAFCAS